MNIDTILHWALHFVLLAVIVLHKFNITNFFPKHDDGNTPSKWSTKYTVYMDALNIVDGMKTSKNRPTLKDTQECLNKLILISSNPHIVLLFEKIMYSSLITVDLQNAFRNLVRVDLGLNKINPN